MRRRDSTAHFTTAINHILKCINQHHSFYYTGTEESFQLMTNNIKFRNFKFRQIIQNILIRDLLFDEHRLNENNKNVFSVSDPKIWNFYVFLLDLPIHSTYLFIWQGQHDQVKSSKYANWKHINRQRSLNCRLYAILLARKVVQVHWAKKIANNCRLKSLNRLKEVK